jgi:hypothetical protein
MPDTGGESKASVESLPAGTRILGSIADYSDLTEIMRSRALELELTREALDARSGVQSGYSGKILAPRPIRRASFDMLSYLLPALGIKLVAVAADVPHGDRSPGRHSATVLIKFSHRHFQRIGRIGGHNSRKNLSKTKARALARKAGKASAMARLRHNGAAHHTEPVR